MSIGTPAYSLLVGLVSLASGLLGGMLGMAAGIFIVPALTLAFGLDIRYAVGASLVSVIGCSCGSAASAMENRLTNVRLAILLEIGTTLGALTGVMLSGIFPESALYLLFAAILVISAFQMFRKRKADGSQSSPGSPPDRWATRLRLNSSYPDPQLQREVAYGVSRVWLGLFLMYAAGTMSSLLGIGSGVLKVPALDSALRLPIKVSSATSNFMIGVTAAASAGIYYARGDILLDVAAPVALGSILGAYLGAKILMRTSNERIRTLFIVVLLVLAVKMFTAAAQGTNPAVGSWR
ncbi:sulfite exporter TauE/SafE family protein [Singulisphaera sp. Ch08]|uniref:Probable membrane transporter protein n=1 Tax=Singulisphaera sp. Ch08 TaxID=3120278 RepID=A0AAU7C9V8_9BACT